MISRCATNSFSKIHCVCVMWNPYRCCFEISNSIKWNISKVFNQEAIRFWCFHVCVLICKYRMNRDQKKTFPIQFESEKFGVYVICEYERTFDILLFAINVLLRPHLIFRKCHVKILIMLMRIFSDLIDILFNLDLFLVSIWHNFISK